MMTSSSWPCRLSIWLGVFLIVCQANVWIDRAVAAGTEAVLPGFSPITLTGTTVGLGGGRTYTWNASYVPTQVTAAGQLLADHFELVLSLNGQEVLLVPSDVSVTDQSAVGVTLQAQGALGHIHISVTTRVEYDGLAMSRLVLSSDQPVTVSHVEFRLAIAKSDNTRLMHWDIPSYRKHIRNFPLSAPEFHGPFQHVVALADGGRSVWWFTDDANQWISNPQNTTDVDSGHSVVRLRQRMLIGDIRPTQPVEISFNLLATPIRDTTPWRAPSHRVARRVTSEEGRGAGLHLWWPEALPHQALPYSEWPVGVTQDIPVADRQRYPGAAGIRTLLAEAKQAGLTRLPYFSAHAPSLYDPVVAAHRAEWEVVPPFVIKPGADAPFVSPLERPWLSLRGPGLIEHLVGRFDQVIDALGFEGLYFDQGAPMSSQHPAHGAWRESPRRTHPTLDILAMRRYFKALAELFHRKGKPGYLMVHMSSVPIMPAYTFVTALVQGEEFLLDLKQTDYIGSVPLDVVRTQYAPGQYGIGSVWLDQLWSPRLPGNPAGRYANQEQWLTSPEHRTAWRNYMALVLLHDVVPWSVAPAKERQEVSRSLDEFGIAHARFVGYWERPLPLSGGEGIVTSLYRHEDGGKVLVVAANTGARATSFSTDHACAAFAGPCPASLRVRVHEAGGWVAVQGGHVDIRIPARDFRLIELAASDAASVPTPSIRTKGVR